MTTPSPSTITENSMDGKIYLPAMLNFLSEIGIPFRKQAIDSNTFVPGLIIEKGVLLIDEEKMLYPGDILHEAGHIAVVPEAQRSSLSEVTGDGEEIAALLWSFAAAKKINLPLEVVFHPYGYKGQSDWLIETYSNGTYVGLPLLEWMGFCASETKSVELNVPAFPHMQRWLRA